MIITIFLVSVGTLALLFFIWLAMSSFGKHTDPTSLVENLQSVDVAAFRNLMDPAAETYLRQNLTSPEFRALRRERLSAAIEYIACAARNASILMRLAENARHSPDPSVVEAAEKLVDTAIRVRLYAFQATAMLYLGMILPRPQIASLQLSERYEQMTRLMVVIACLQNSRQHAAAAL
jgi:hypothetical protein